MHLILSKNIASLELKHMRHSVWGFLLLFCVDLWSLSASDAWVKSVPVNCLQFFLPQTGWNYLDRQQSLRSCSIARVLLSLIGINIFHWFQKIFTWVWIEPSSIRLNHREKNHKVQQKKKGHGGTSPILSELALMGT